MKDETKHERFTINEKGVPGKPLLVNGRPITVSKRFLGTWLICSGSASVVRWVEAIVNDILGSSMGLNRCRGSIALESERVHWQACFCYSSE